MERMFCSQFQANAVFLRIGVVAHNPFVLFQHFALAEAYCLRKAVTVRRQLWHSHGKVVRHSAAWILKIAPETLDVFGAIRAKSMATA